MAPEANVEMGGRLSLRRRPFCVFSGTRGSRPGRRPASAMRVRTVPKDAKEQKEQKKDEPTAITPKQLTTSTASLISSKESKSDFTVRNCSQSKNDPCDKLLAQGGVAK